MTVAAAAVVVAIFLYVLANSVRLTDERGRDFVLRLPFKFWLRIRRIS